MSISGSGEVKTAVLAAGAAAGTNETAAMDAQEDREIVGLHVDAQMGAGGPNLSEVRTRLFIGTDVFSVPGAGETVTDDNRSFHWQSRFEREDDDVNGNGAAGGSNDGEWFGHGSGIEWNEDATLSLNVQSGQDPNNATATVYYREL